MSGSFWKKLEAAKAKGISQEEFSRIEELEHAIVKYETEIENYKREIKNIEKAAKLRKKKAEER